MRPYNTDVTIEHTEDGIVIAVPPVGVLHDNGWQLFYIISMFLFAILFTITTRFFSAPTPPHFVDSTLQLIPFFLVLAYYLLAIAHLLRVVRTGQHRATFIVNNDTLEIVQHAPFIAPKCYKFRRNELVDIESEYVFRLWLPFGKKGFKSRSIYVLQIHLPMCKTHKMLSQLRTDEIEWIAQELRTVLRLNEEPDSKA